MSAAHPAWKRGWWCSRDWPHDGPCALRPRVPMSAEARRNGWRGFDSFGEQVPGGWQYDCNGMPTLMGCGEQITITRRYVRVGTKSTGWLVCYGTEFPGDPGDDGKGNDLDVVLTFGPKCAAVVREQIANTT